MINRYQLYEEGKELTIFAELKREGGELLPKKIC